MAQIDPVSTKDLFYRMHRIRRVEETIAERYADQEMRCPVHLSIGQEAIAVGVCSSVRPTDYVMSTHRAHAHYLAKGGDLNSLMAELYGRVTGCSQGKGGSMHLMDLSAGFLGATPIVASSIPIAVGAAFGSIMQGNPRVVVSFFGEAATEEGVFAESLNFAVLKKLPVIFVCENNLYSVYSPLEVRQPLERDLLLIAKGHGAETCRGDGNDVSEVFQLASQAVARAVRGDGPTVMELTTYRWREHVGPDYDNHLGYRTEAEFLNWKAQDPLEKAKLYLLNKGSLTEDQVQDMERRVAREIDEAVSFAIESPYPPVEHLARHLFA